jgi:hypothetical protein
VNGVDDLGVVDALEVDGGDAEVAVAELALDDDQRHTFARHLDCVRVAKLVRREASPYVGAEDAATDTDAVRGADVILRLEPGALRVWDFADEYDTG